MPPCGSMQEEPGCGWHLTRSLPQGGSIMGRRLAIVVIGAFLCLACTSVEDRDVVTVPSPTSEPTLTPEPTPTPTPDPILVELEAISAEVANLVSDMLTTKADVDTLANDICPTYMWELTSFYQDEVRKAYGTWGYKVERLTSDTDRTNEETIDNFKEILAATTLAIVPIREARDVLEGACLQSTSR